MTEDTFAMPAAVETEAATAACMIRGGEIALAAFPFTAEHFHLLGPRVVFRACLDMMNQLRPIDLVTLTQYLRDNNLIADCGGEIEGQNWEREAYVTALCSCASYPNQLPEYFAILEEHRKRRQIILSCLSAAGSARSGQTSTADITDRLDKSLRNADTENVESETPEAVQAASALVMSRMLGEETGIATGVPMWDANVGRVKRSRLIILGARPKVGKTALMETMAEKMIFAGVPVLFFQRDMSIVDMILRMACRRAGVIFERVDNGTANPVELRRVQYQLGKLGELQKLLRVYSPRNMTSAEIRATVKREIRDNGISVMFLDVFQRIKVSSSSLAEGLTQASKDLRDITTDFELPLIVAAHLNKDADATQRPNAGQFKYCDQLFSDCDTAALMWSDEDPKDLIDTETGEHTRQHVLITIDANRGGVVGDVHTYFDRPHMRFHAERD